MKKILISLLCGTSMWLASFASVYGMEAILWQSPIQYAAEVIAPFGQVRGGYTHEGIDVVAPMYTPLYAVAGGRVVKAAPDSKGVTKGGGHMIFIEHEDGSNSRYMHLSAYGVKEGDYVLPGQWIGFSGATGDVTGPHLHLEYRIGGVPVDPWFLFEPQIEDVMVDEAVDFESYFRVEQQ
ncbi:MAG: M23 family metallopeptidase [Cellulosilyticaceae bacterium]